MPVIPMTCIMSLEKTSFCTPKQSCRSASLSAAKLIGVFVFCATHIVKSFYLLLYKISSLSHLLLLHSTVHVRPGRKTQTGFLMMRLSPMPML